MSSPDRRPVLYAAVGAAILILAFFLFRQDGGSDEPADTMVLRPELPADTELQAAVDEGQSEDPDMEMSDEAEPESVEEDPFPVEDATLESAPASTPVPTPVSTPVESKPVRSEPIRVETSSPAPGLGGDYFVVVGSYGDPNNAQRLVRRLDARGIAADIESTTGANGPVHRVRVGYFADHSRAEAFGRKLQKDMQLDFWVSSR